MKIRINLRPPAIPARPSPTAEALPGPPGVTQPIPLGGSLSLGPTAGIEGLFRQGATSTVLPPSPERLPDISTHLLNRLQASREILARLERIKVWGTPARDEHRADIDRILERIEERQGEYRSLEDQLGTIATETAVPLSWKIIAFYLRVRELEREISSHEILGRVLRSEIVNRHWALEPAAVDTEGGRDLIPDLTPFLEEQHIEPGQWGRIELLLLRYEYFLSRKKGGELGPPLRDQPFDLDAFAAALLDEPDRTVAGEVLKFLSTVWKAAVPEPEAAVAARTDLAARLEDLRREKRPFFPHSYEIVMPERDDSLAAYIRQFGMDEEDENLQAVVGVRLSTIGQWGKKGRRPRDIGMIASLYRYTVEVSWNRETLHARHGGKVRVPDPIEILRLAYGEWAEPFFKSLNAGDPWTVEVPVPEEVTLSYAEMYYSRVLQEVLAASRGGSDRAAEALRAAVASAGTAGEEGSEEDEPARRRPHIAASTFRRHLRGQVAPHRRYVNTRGCMRVLLGKEGGEVFDFLLEAKSVLDQFISVRTPDGRSIEPEEGVRSRWNLRLVPRQDALIDFTAGRPDLSPERLPYKYLEGERDEFTLLLEELRARLEFFRVLERNLQEPVSIGEGEAVSVAELFRLLKDYEGRHRRLLAKLRHLRLHPEQIRVSDPRNFEQFYRHLLLFARTVRNRIRLGGEIRFRDLTLFYEVVPPEANATGSASVTAVERPGSHGIWDIQFVPDILTSLIAGEGLSPEGARDLLQVRIVEEVLRQKGLLPGDGNAAVIQAVLGDRPAKDPILAVLRLYHHLESERIDISRLSPSQEDVVALYERADRGRGQIAETRPGGWLERRLEEFLRNRFGLAAGIDFYREVLRKYFELHPRFAEVFDRPALDLAFREILGDQEVPPAKRGRVLEFLSFIGLPAGETRKTPAPAPARSPAPLPGPAPELPHTRNYPSASSQIRDHFLSGRSELPRELPIPRADLTLLLDRLVLQFEEGIRKTQRLPETEVRQEVEGYFRERATYLGVAVAEPARAAVARLGYDYLCRVQEILPRFLSGLSEALTRRVAEEFLFQLVTKPEVEPLNRLAYRIVGERVRDIRPTSSAYQRALSGVEAWFEQTVARLRRENEELLTLFDLLDLEDGVPTTRTLFMEFFIRKGREYGTAHFESLREEKDWEEVLRGHEAGLLIFLPEEGGELKGRWDRLTASLEPDPPREAPPAEREPTPRPPTSKVHLPASLWNPADFSFLPHDEHQRLWRQVFGHYQKGERGHVLFYLGEGGVRTRLVSERDAVVALEILSQGGSYSYRPTFTDLETGEGFSVPPVHVKMCLKISERESWIAAWLSELKPEDPLWPDLQFLEGLIFSLPILPDFSGDFTDMVSEITEKPENWDPKAIRGILNGFFEKHSEMVRRARRFASRVGVWHPSTKTIGEINRTLEKDPARLSRFWRVLDLLEEEGEMPEDFLGEVREAIAVLEKNPSVAEGRIGSLIDRIASLAPRATEVMERRLRTILPEDFNDLATAKELSTQSHYVRLVSRGYCSQILKDCEQDLGSESEEARNAARLNRDVFTTLINIFQDPDLEVIHRPLAVLYFPQVAPGSAMIQALSQQVVRRRSWISDPKRKGKLIELVLRFYRDHRTEILWRLRENRGLFHFGFFRDAVPEDTSEMGRRFVRSDRFPELEEVTFHDLDRMCADALDSITYTDRKAYVLEVEEGGLWKRCLVTKEVAEGLRDKVRDREEQITVEDLRGGTYTFSWRAFREANSIESIRSSVVHLFFLGLEHQVLIRDDFRDIHPMVALFFNMAFRTVPQGTDPTYLHLREVAEQFVKDPDRFGRDATRLRREILSAYQAFRSQILFRSAHERFERHLRA